MTRDEWDAVMTRYMHRKDLAGDLQQTFDFARQQVRDAWSGTVPFVDDSTLLASAGTAMTHAGLMYLHELAQDDESLSRETGLFSPAMADVQRRWSYDNVARPRAQVKY